MIKTQPTMHALELNMNKRTLSTRSHADDLDVVQNVPASPIFVVRDPTH